jgi:hypothetical protein
VTRRYRYRTSVLVGSWRSTRSKAVEDAVNAGQASRPPDRPDVLTWAVPGSIEEKNGDHPAERELGCLSENG